MAHIVAVIPNTKPAIEVVRTVQNETYLATLPMFHGHLVHLFVPHDEALA
jgi:hypothetical protein